MKNIIAGLLFAMLWASASAATKIGLLVAQPLVIGNCRFFIAGFIMLFYTYAIQKNRLPQGKEWQQLLMYGFLNVTIYLGCFVLAMKHVSAGIGSLSTATNPLIISMLSAFWSKRPVKLAESIGLLLGILGVAVATYPLLQNSFASIEGLLILSASMLSYSVGTIYYANQKWELPLLAINGWQVLLGGILLLPVTFFFTDWNHNQYTVQFWGSVFWLVVPVSIGAVQLWLYLLKTDAVKASLWLFLCPIFGFVYASFLLNEPITTYTYAGTALVIVGLYLAQRTTISRTEK